MKTGLFGGTFDPVHYGHINMAACFCRQFSLDKLIIMPDFIPPHKGADRSVNASHRYEMARLAFSDYGYSPITEVSDDEIRRGGTSYTYDTLSSLKTKGYDGLYLLCGQDMLRCFDTWYRYTDILRMCTVVCAARGDNDGSLERDIDKYLKTDGSRIYTLDAPYTDISSRQIREARGRGEDISRFVPPEVAEYIEKNELYCL